MKLLDANYDIIEERDITKLIERVARLCYKSEDKICPGSDIELINKLINKKHYAMLEHGNICFVVSKAVYDEVNVCVEFFNNVIKDVDNVKEYRPVSRMRRTYEPASNRYVVSGNLRAWMEFLEDVDVYGLNQEGVLNILIKYVRTASNGVVDFTHIVNDELTRKEEFSTIHQVKDFYELTPAERMIHETMSVQFTVDRGVTHELVRMRDASFGQESTRYCDYGADKFERGVMFIKPHFFEEGSREWIEWLEACNESEEAYLELVKGFQATPQQARCTLSHSVKADIVVTAQLGEWRHIFNLRACDATGPAHPQMKEVMIPCLQDAKMMYEFAFGDLRPATL